MCLKIHGTICLDDQSTILAVTLHSEINACRPNAVNANGQIKTKQGFVLLIQ